MWSAVIMPSGVEVFMCYINKTSFILPQNQCFIWGMSDPRPQTLSIIATSVFLSSAQNQYAIRRMSDPSSSSGSRFPGGFRRALSMKKSRSDAETMDAGLERGEEEVVAGTFQDGMHNYYFTSIHLNAFSCRQDQTMYTFLAWVALNKMTDG